jgi:hypothetical protein
MGRKKIYLRPPKVVKIRAEDKDRLKVLSGMLGQQRQQDVPETQVMTMALDALEARLSEGAHAA